MAEEKKQKRFFKDFKGELKKVIWPTSKQTAKNTVAVIFLVILVSLVVLVLDFGFRKGYDFAVDRVIGGTISDAKSIFKEMRKYSTEQQVSMYEQFYSAGYIDIEQLKQALEEMKNPTEQPAAEENVEEDSTQDTETNATQQ